MPDRILRAMDTPMIDHRGPEFAKLAKRCLEGIKTIFKTKSHVFIFPASGTGAWEAALTNVLSPGEHVIMYETGHFAALWNKLAQRLGIQSEVIGLPGIEGWWQTEREVFVGLCERWRNIPKPTIAQVQGRVIAGGLMLVWPCDLVVAADDALFSDPVVAFGVNGVEYFRHPFEVGARRAKEMLFTGDDITADEARALGMVNRVVPRAELGSATLELAVRIAQRSSMGLRLAKESVNRAEDRMGVTDVVHAAHSLHVLGHSHNLNTHGILVDPAGARVIRESKKK